MSIVLPRHDDLMLPILKLLVELGGSGTNEEINTGLVESLALTPEQMAETYERTGVAILPDRMSWARSYLKYPNFVDNPKRGVWVLTEAGRTAAEWTDAQVRKAVSDGYNSKQAVLRAEKAKNAPPKVKKNRRPTGPISFWLSCKRSIRRRSNASASVCCASMGSHASK